MHGLKSAILALFQPCPASAALQSGSQIFLSLIFKFLSIFFLNETIVRSRPWYFGRLDADPSSVLCYKLIRFEDTEAEVD